MMFHRNGLMSVIHSRDEEDGLGADWRRTVWPAEATPPVEPAPEPPPASAVPESDPWAPDEASAFEPAPKKRKRR